MTLSALSMQMKALETHLGAALFDRSFRPPKLTPLGRRVAQQGETVLTAQRRLTEICATGDPLAGQFRLGFIQSASVRILPGFLTRIKATAPGAALEFSTGLSEDLCRDVALGLLDAAIVTRVDHPRSAVQFTVIGSEEMAFAVPARHAATPLDALPMALPFIHFRASSGIGNLIAGSLRALPDQPRETLFLDSLEAAVECVKAGLGYTLLPLPDIERCADGRVFIHRSREGAMWRDLALATRPENHDTLWARHLADILRDLVAPPAKDPE